MMRRKRKIDGARITFVLLFCVRLAVSFGETLPG
jgi:hypothetical protein